jgi:hypothetical protein
MITNGILFLSWLLVFTLFDIVGHKYLCESKPNKYYQVLQCMFQVATLGLVWSMSSLVVALACLFAWWALVCDVLYYIFTRTQLDPFTWFRYSMFGIYYQVFNKNDNAVLVDGVWKGATPVSKVKLSAWLGLGIGLVVSMVLG